MKRWILLAAAFSVLAVPALYAADCVDVDVELPATVTAGSTTPAEGYFEVSNCGDDVATVTIGVSVDFNGHPLTIGNIPLRMGAGETISRNFRFIAPPAAAGATVTLCLNASAGTATASDCATMDIVAGSADGTRTFEFALVSATSACVDATLELPDTVYAGPAAFGEGSFDLTNCGDEAAVVNLALTVDAPIGPDVEIMRIPVRLGAGGMISKSFKFPIPPSLPDGEATLCVTATSGDAVTTTCQTVVIVSATLPTTTALPTSLSADNYPNPFNPSTTISFALPTSGSVKVEIYNMLGQTVRTLVDGQTMEAGQHSVVWNGDDNSGRAAASGVYLYRIEVGGESITKKMLLTK